MTAAAETDLDRGSDRDSRAFRDALGEFATGVTVITTSGEAGEPVGLTANSFNSVSLDPPMVLFSLARDSGSLPAFRSASWWAVHVLAADQEALSVRFASREVDRFAGLPHRRGPGGVPLLEGFAARFICRTAFEYEGGDHAIFLGEVREFDRAGRPPLVYHQGKYGGVLPAGSDESISPLDVLRTAGLITAGADPARVTARGAAILRGIASLAEECAALSEAERRSLAALLLKLCPPRPGADAADGGTLQ